MNPIMLTSIHGQEHGLTKGGHICGHNILGIHTGRVDGVNGGDYFLRPNPLIVEKFDDFLGAVCSTNDWNVLKGSDGSCANAINAALDGINRLTTGAGATHTMAVNGAQLVGMKNFKPQGAAGAGPQDRRSQRKVVAPERIKRRALLQEEGPSF